MPCSRAMKKVKDSEVAKSTAHRPKWAATFRRKLACHPSPSPGPHAAKGSLARTWVATILHLVGNSILF